MLKDQEALKEQPVLWDPMVLLDLKERKDQLDHRELKELKVELAHKEPRVQAVHRVRKERKDLLVQRLVIHFS